MATIPSIVSAGAKGFSTIAHGATNAAIATGANIGIGGSNNQAVETMNSALQDGVASQASMALAQVQAATQQFAIGAQQQQANSTLHMAQSAIATAVKFQNKMSDDAKDAI